MGAIIRRGIYTTRWGKRRRYQCRSCRKTFCAATRTPYYRLQHRRTTFDEVASLSVEGLNKSAIARVKRIACNTVHRWLERAAVWCRGFNDRRISGLSLVELQADEIRTIVRGKEQPIWVFAVIDVWSRLFPSTTVGGRRYRNTLALFRLQQALQDSEDSEKLNTSFVERLNLTIRQGSAYLGRRTTCHARWKERLEDHLELLRCHYNFARRHRGLKFGSEMRTPAMQAGLAKRRLSFRDIFSASSLFWLFGKIRFVFTYCSISVHVHDLRFSKAA